MGPPLCLYSRQDCEWVSVKSFSCGWLFAIPWTVAHQASLSLGFSRQEYWSGLPFSSPWGKPLLENSSLQMWHLLLPGFPQEALYLAVFFYSGFFFVIVFLVALFKNWYSTIDTIFLSLAKFKNFHSKTPSGMYLRESWLSCLPLQKGRRKKLYAQRGARTHDPEIKSLMLYRLS